MRIGEPSNHIMSKIYGILERNEIPYTRQSEFRILVQPNNQEAKNLELKLHKAFVKADQPIFLLSFERGFQKILIEDKDQCLKQEILKQL